MSATNDHRAAAGTQLSVATALPLFHTKVAMWPQQPPFEIKSWRTSAVQVGPRIVTEADGGPLENNQKNQGKKSLNWRGDPNEQ